MLKQAFPEAEVTGLDLSPQMLTVAQHKAERLNLAISWQQGLAEATSYSDGEFDLISVA